VLTCTGKPGKSCCESTVHGLRVWNFTITPYLSDQLAELLRQVARTVIPFAQQAIHEQRHVREALHGRVEIAGVA
jgi:hypothetical protein